MCRAIQKTSVIHTVPLLVFFCLLNLSVQISADEKKFVELEKITTLSNEYPAVKLDEPFSEKRFGRETIEERQFKAVQDVADAVPNLNVLDTGTRSFADVISVRGLSYTPLANNPVLLIYFDDVPFGGPYTYANQLFGIDSIEVFQGPQGARFGANAYGGVINVKSRQPDNQWISQFSSGTGNRNQWNGNAYTSGAMIPNELYFTLGANYAQRDGFLKNTYLHNRPDNQQQIGARTSLKWTPTENWDLRIASNVDYFHDGTPRLVRLTDAFFNPLDEILLEIRSDLSGKVDQTIDSQSLRIAYRGDSYELVSVTARRNWNLDPVLLDSDFSPQPIAILEFREDQEQWIEEIRIRSTLPDAVWKWTAGFFFTTSQLNASRRFTFFGISDSQRWKIDEDDFAIFGQLSFRPIDPLRLDAGLRFDYIQKKLNLSVSSPQVNVSSIESRQHYFFVSPNFAVNYDLTDQTSLYANTALAYKPGGYRPFVDNNGPFQFDRERTWANEVGLKWLGKSMEATLALFYYRIHDYQVEQFTNLFDFTVVNAEETESYGVELQLRKEFWDRFILQSAFGYNRVRFLKNKNSTNQSDFSGNTAPFSPEFNWMLAAEYRHPRGLFARAEGVWTGKTYFDQQNTPLFSLGDYAIFNMRIGFEYRSFRLDAYGYNLTDTQYFTSKFPSAFAGTPGEPRTYGVRLSMHF